jgi:hypothetical protein
MSLIVTLVGSGLVLSGQSDLDTLSPQVLAQDLEDELDDLFDELGLHEDEQYMDKYLFDEIMIALSDQGDDADEDDITFEELEDEMAEASTTLQAVITGAVDAADQMSFRQESSLPQIVLARSFGGSPFFGPPSSTAGLKSVRLDPLGQRANQRGWAVAGVAKTQAATGLTNAIRRAR